MKQRKAIGLGILAVAAVMAISVVSAQASTTLCVKAEGVCAAANQYAVGTVLEGQTFGATATLTGPKAIGNVTCESTIIGESTGAAATVAVGALPGEVTGLSWKNCVLSRGTPEAINCVVKSINLPYASAVTSSGKGDGNGALTVTAKPKGGNPGATVNCPGVIECEYTTAAAGLTATGGAVGVGFIEAAKVGLAMRGGKCPVATLDAKYLLAEPRRGVWVEE
jgi:hypothetical protein